MRDRVRCQATMGNGWQCERQASYWVERRAGAGRFDVKAEPRCRFHAERWLLAWPMVTGSPDHDRLRDQTR